MRVKISFGKYMKPNSSPVARYITKNGNIIHSLNRITGIIPLTEVSDVHISDKRKIKDTQKTQAKGGASFNNFYLTEK